MINLSKLFTSHPGGFEDIVQFLAKKEIKVEFHHLQRNSVTHSQLQTIESVSILQYVEKLCAELSSSGAVVMAIYKLLIRYKLPLPIDKQWSQACAFWPDPVLDETVKITLPFEQIVYAEKEPENASNSEA